MMRVRGFKVLFLAPTSFFADYGCHVRILEEALALQRMGHQVLICTYHTGDDVEGIRIERAMGIPWRNRVEVGSSLHKIFFDLLLYLKASWAALRWKPDIVHGHLHEGAFIGYPVSRLCGAPLVFDFQGSLTSEMIDHHFLQRDSLFYLPMRRLEEVINRLPQAIITSSRHATSLLSHEFGCPEERIHIVSDCVNADFFQPRHDEGERTHLKAQLGVPEDRRVVVYLGLLAEYQGIGLLLKGIASLRHRFQDAHFLIMGFPGVADYQMMARELSIEHLMTLPGKIPYREAPRYLSLGEVAVAPKISATEGNGKLLNYMAMGLPTVAFDTPVNREYLGDYGVYAPRDDAEAFAQAIRSLLDDGERAQELGRCLRQRAVERYSWDRAGKEIVEIYESLSKKIGG